MTDLTVERTLVKSPPELWTELSEVETLARHLGELGEIRISKLEPEHTVAWEGEHARGMVELSASGWGTKVTLTAEVAEPEPDAPAAELIEEPAEEQRPLYQLAEAPEEDEDDTPYFTVPERRPRWWRRWADRRGTRRRPAQAAPAGEVGLEIEAQGSVDPIAPVAPEPEPASDAVPEAQAGVDPDRVRTIFETTLDNLGQAHHRPFSRG